ncbi:MAG TPA: polysaccharide deacetylase family protein [Bacilli bacterium]
MNILTVDVEDYYQTNGLNIPQAQWRNYPGRVERNTGRLLECFERHKAKATFFIVGEVAKRYPALVRDIVQAGHEIGSHTLTHRMLSTLTRESFRADVRASKAVLEDIAGVAVKQFRAPSWSLNAKIYDWLCVLEEEGYSIDSSLQPFYTPLGGSNRAPLAPFRPIIRERQLQLVEFPASVYKWGIARIPFSGGFYLRALPLTLIHLLLKKTRRLRPFMLYIHPWEIDPEQPRLPASLPVQIMQYYGLAKTAAKLEWLLGHYSFAPLGKTVELLLEGGNIPDLAMPVPKGGKEGGPDGFT